jgi:hypothetical protein
MLKAGTIGLVLLASVALFDAPAPAIPSASTVYCPSAYTAVTNALANMEAQLQVGLNFNQYESLLVRVRTAYNLEPVNRASLACLNGVGIPTEQAMNDYIEASNSWAVCNQRIFAGLSSDCVTPGSYGESHRQIYWARASASIQKAVDSLG